MKFATKLSAEKLALLVSQSLEERNNVANEYAQKLVDRMRDIYGIRTYVAVATELDGTVRWDISHEGLLPQIKKLAEEISTGE